MDIKIDPESVEVLPEKTSSSDNETVHTFSNGVYLEFTNLVVNVTKKEKARSFKEVFKRRHSSKRILDNVSGTIAPGSLMAVMGASGAGKSTLLNTLALRNDPASGTITWNNKPIDDEFLKHSAYVQQEDMFFPNLTVLEHLQIQAELRLPIELSSDEKKKITENLIHTLGLSKCRDSTIGNIQAGGGRGISGGERKRLAIASELITNPRVIFLDEPTSGLDSHMAFSVVKLLKKLASQGCTIICTIHQPSSDVFALFDQLLLLSDGRLVYNDRCQKVLDYFSSIGYPCKPYMNPADFIIDLVSLPYNDEEAVKRVKYLCDSWREKGNTQRAIVYGSTHSPAPTDHSTITPPPKSNEGEMTIDIGNFGGLTLGHSFKQRFTWREMKVLFHRSWLNMKRDRLLTKARLIQTLFLSIFMGFVFFRLANNARVLTNKGFATFFTIMNQSMLSIMGVVNSFPSEKAIVKREYEGRAYHLLSYFMAKTFADFPFQIVFPTIFSLIIYFLVGFNDNFVSFILFTVVLLLSTNAAISLGYCISSLVPSTNVALAVAPMAIIPFSMFSGFNINSKDLLAFWTPFEYISFFRYGFHGCMIAIFNYDYPDIHCDAGSDICPKDGKAVLNYFSIDYDLAWLNYVVLVFMIVFYRALAYLLLKTNIKSKANATK